MYALKLGIIVFDLVKGNFKKNKFLFNFSFLKIKENFPLWRRLFADSWHTVPVFSSKIIPPIFIQYRDCHHFLVAVVGTKFQLKLNARFQIFKKYANHCLGQWGDLMLKNPLNILKIRQDHISEQRFCVIRKK